jgi:zinc/manganese transport system substrate-binding protein
METRLPRHQTSSQRVGVSAVIALLLVSVLGAACNSAAASGAGKPGVIKAIGAENEYADVLSQIGGKYVTVSSILDNPNTDPHTFEASPQVAEEVSTAQLIVQNGVGYDTFMNRIEAASPNSSRKVIVVQQLLGLPDSTPNPHLWYDPTTMPIAAAAMEKSLAELASAHASYFEANLKKFDASLVSWTNAIASFRALHEDVTAATTEPVADYMLQAMGIKNLTPWTFQDDIMNGVDPSPQDISIETGFFTHHTVKLFCYNQQVVDSLTESIRQDALSHGVPVVGVYETMPAGYHYQSWMLAEVHAIEAAITTGKSTEQL